MWPTVRFFPLKQEKKNISTVVIQFQYIFQITVLQNHIYFKNVSDVFTLSLFGFITPTARVSRALMWMFNRCFVLGEGYTGFTGVVCMFSCAAQQSSLRTGYS